VTRTLLKAVLADAKLEAKLEQLIAAARSAWPALDIEAAAFTRYVEQRLAPGQTPEAALAQVRIDDLYLACGCALGLQAAHAAFDAVYLATLDGALRSAGTTLDQVEEVKQLLREQLLLQRGAEPPAIAKYSGRGALKSWLRVTAVRRAHRYRSQVARQPRPDEDRIADAVSPELDPELATLKLRYRDTFKTAIQDAVAALPADDRTLFKHYFLDDLTLDQIGRLYGVHKATISRRLGRARESVLRGTRESLRRQLRLSASEFHSLMVVVQSQIDLSIHRLLLRDE